LGQNVFGNAVATVIFSVMTDVLAIDAAVEVELHASSGLRQFPLLPSQAETRG
jgi:hypothetical protein